MKLRIRDNSIRLRLTRTEVDTLSSAGRVCARVSFPGGAGLDYTIESSTVTARPAALFSEGTLAVLLPDAEVKQWASTEQVSIAAEELLDDGDHLNILVEKDYACLAPREGEDDSDMFPNPLEGQG